MREREEVGGGGGGRGGGREEQGGWGKKEWIKERHKGKKNVTKVMCLRSAPLLLGMLGSMITLQERWFEVPILLRLHLVETFDNNWSHSILVTLPHLSWKLHSVLISLHLQRNGEDQLASLHTAVLSHKIWILGECVSWIGSRSYIYL